MVLAELEKTISLLEAQIPANPNAPKHQKLERSLQRSLSKYFRALGTAFPYGSISKLYNKYVKETLGSDTRGMLDRLLKFFAGNLTTKVSGHLADIYLSGSAEMITWGKTKGGVPIAFEGPPIGQAVNWAKDQGAKLVTRMDEETKRRLANVISDGIKNKRGVPGIARDIRGHFDNMTKYRSELIAKSETRDALFKASHDRSVEMEITGKEWVLGAGGVEGNCPECIANAAMGVIPLEQVFPTPEEDIHPGCTCAIAPAKLKK